MNNYIQLLFFFWTTIASPILLFIFFMLNVMWNYMDEEWSSNTTNGIQNTMATYAGIQRDKMSNHPIFWRLKLYYLHAVMLPGFLLKMARDRLHHECIVLMCLVIYPMVDLVVMPIYWLTIVYAVIGIFWVTFMQNIRYSKWLDIKYKPRERHKLRFN